MKKVARARDVRAEKQMNENMKGTEKDYVDTEISEAKNYANNEASKAENNAKSYTDDHEAKDNPHIGSASNIDLNNHTSASNPHSSSQIRQGGTTANRPSSPTNYQFYFDTDLGKPIWYNGTDWVDSTGTVV